MTSAPHAGLPMSAELNEREKNMDLNELADRPRSATGKFVSTACQHRNCDGALHYEADGWWRCDGLTYEEIDGPLYACTFVHHPLYADASARSQATSQ